MPSTNITSHFYTYVRDTCRFSSDSDAPTVIHLRNPICHLPRLLHSSTHMLGTHAGFRVIPTLRRSFTSKTLDRGDPQIYPYSFLHTRVDQWYFFFIYVCVAHMYMDNQGLDTFHHIIHTC